VTASSDNRLCEADKGRRPYRWLCQRYWAPLGEIRDQSQLYGLLDRVRDLGLELVSVQPQPVADPPTDNEETTR